MRVRTALGDLTYSNHIYYLENYNAGKPIIIAAHSQGSMHAKRLIHDFFDETPLQEKLVAAYLIGVKILPNEFKNIHPLEIADATGGFVSWNSYRKNRLPKRYESWYKGGVVTNPITWDAQNTSDEKDHLGVLYSDFKVYSKMIEKMKGVESKNEARFVTDIFLLQADPTPETSTLHVHIYF